MVNDHRYHYHQHIFHPSYLHIDSLPCKIKMWNKSIPPETLIGPIGSDPEEHRRGSLRLTRITKSCTRDLGLFGLILGLRWGSSHSKPFNVWGRHGDTPTLLKESYYGPWGLLDKSKLTETKIIMTSWILLFFTSSPLRKRSLKLKV